MHVSFSLWLKELCAGLQIYLYGNGLRSYILAVVVPSEGAASFWGKECKCLLSPQHILALEASLSAISMPQMLVCFPKSTHLNYTLIQKVI